MKYYMMPVVKASSIEKAVKLQYDTEIELNTLFWGGKPSKFEPIRFNDKAIKEAKRLSKYFGDSYTAKRLLVFSILEDEFADFPREIIVDTEA